MRNQCSVPSCCKPASTHWATVPVCRDCWNEIWYEQTAYYAGKLLQSERETFIRIRHKTPFWKYNKRKLLQEA